MNAIPRRMQRSWLTWGGLALALVLVVAVNVLAERMLGSKRIDLTEARLYTLSDGTRSVLGSLDEPVTLRLYYSRKLGQSVPIYATYAARVTELLQEYVALSNGRLVLELYEPEPFSEVEDRALALGLQGVPIDQSGEQVFFGLAGSNSVDDERSIPFFQPERERFLEYDLTRLVYELSNPKRPRIGLLSTLPIDGDMRMAMMGGRPSPPWVALTQLRQFFTVEAVAADAAVIPDGMDVLLLIHPQELSDATLYAIDQFVLRGGRLVAFVDPASDAQASRPGPGGRPPAELSSNLPRLFETWGVAYDPEQVVGDLTGALRVRAGPSERVQAVDFVGYFTLRGAQIARDAPATAELNQVTLATPGSIGLREGSTLRLEPILTSSTQAQLLPATQLRSNPNPVAILAAFRPSGETYTLAATLRGPVRSAFAEPPAPPEGAPERPAHRTEGQATIVLFADADLLEDRFWVQVREFFGQQVATPFADNGAMVINLVDTLSGSDAMIGLRSRGESQRPFEVVEAMRREADAAFREREQALQKRLEETEARLRELRQGAGDARGAVLTPEQARAIEEARSDIVRTRGELRTVQRDLRRDIEALETNLRIANIAAVPLLVGLFAVGLGAWRAQRRRAGGRREG